MSIDQRLRGRAASSSSGPSYDQIEVRHPPACQGKSHAVVGVGVGVIDLLVAATGAGDELLRVSAPRSKKAAQETLRRLQRQSWSGAGRTVSTLGEQ